jgi:hypothetical protein
MKTICKKKNWNRRQLGNKSGVLDLKNGTSAHILREISIFYLDCREFCWSFIHGIFDDNFRGYSQHFYTVQKGRF